MNETCMMPRSISYTFPAFLGDFRLCICHTINHRASHDLQSEIKTVHHESHLPRALKIPRNAALIPNGTNLYISEHSYSAVADRSPMPSPPLRFANATLGIAQCMSELSVHPTSHTTIRTSPYSYLQYWCGLAAPERTLTPKMFC